MSDDPRCNCGKCRICKIQDLQKAYNQEHQWRLKAEQLCNEAHTRADELSEKLKVAVEALQNQTCSCGPHVSNGVSLDVMIICERCQALTKIRGGE